MIMRKYTRRHVHVSQPHMKIATAPRRDNGTRTKRETDQLWLSFGFRSLGNRARLNAGSASSWIDYNPRQRRGL